MRRCANPNPNPNPDPDPDPDPNPKQVREALRFIDTDGSGVIDRDEIKEPYP